jgi:ribosomal protein S18 acetylase RimI-like enzyme
MLLIEIRALNESDLPNLFKLEAKSPEKGWTRKEFYKFMTKRTAAAFVATDNSNIIGYVLLEVAKPDILVRRLTIQPPYRRRKVGRSLLEYLAEQLAKIKWKRIQADIPDTNLIAHLFLRACKYRATHVIRATAGWDRDLYHFEFRLKWPARALKSDKKGAFAQAGK